MPTCNQCGMCCKIVIMNGIFATDDLMEYFAARGWEYDRSIKRVTIPQVCPHLKDNKCDIYETRPNYCKRYPLKIPGGVAVPRGCAFEKTLRKR